MEPSRSAERLREIQKTIGLPVRLSDVEKEKFTETFASLKVWMDESLEAVLVMPRDAAYRYIDLLILGLQKVDVDFVAGVDTTKILSEVAEEPKIPPVPVVKPTKEEVDGWLSELTPEIRAKASEIVDCLKQYLDPEGPGMEVICPHCTKAELEQCIRNADPSIEDSGSIFMRVQTE